jgi:hypothetical protein
MYFMLSERPFFFVESTVIGVAGTALHANFAR